MAIATIKVEYNCGDAIESCFTESKRLATLLNVWIEFNFNDVSCLIHNKGDVSQAVLDYMEQLNKPEKSDKIVVS